MTTSMPQTFALNDGDRQLLHDAIAVSAEAHEAALTGSVPTRLFVGMQVAGLTMTLEKVLDRMTQFAAAYEQGWRDREAVTQAATKPTLRLVSG